MNIYPGPSLRKNFPYNSSDSFSGDCMSLKKDWESIGRDFSNVCKTIEENGEIYRAIGRSRELIHKST